MEYKVTVKETLRRVVIVNADSSEDAKDMVTEMYENEEIVLGAEDHVKTLITVGA